MFLARQSFFDKRVLLLSSDSVFAVRQHAPLMFACLCLRFLKIVKSFLKNCRCPTAETSSDAFSCVTSYQQQRPQLKVAEAEWCSFVRNCRILRWFVSTERQRWLQSGVTKAWGPMSETLHPRILQDVYTPEIMQMTFLVDFLFFPVVYWQPFCSDSIELFHPLMSKESEKIPNSRDKVLFVDGQNLARKVLQFGFLHVTNLTSNCRIFFSLFYNVWFLLR